MTEPAGTPVNAIRTTSKTGGAKDVKIQRFDQIPAGPLAELAARYGIGSLKYPQVNGLDNWRNGYPWSYSYRALVGHANDFWRGEDVDPNAYLGTDNESSLDEEGNPRPGVTHLAAVAWHALALLHWAETHPEYDDRESTVLARQAAGLSATEEGPEDALAQAYEQGWRAALVHVGESTPCQEPEICRNFAACSVECERRYAGEEHAGLDVDVNPNIPEGSLFTAPASAWEDLGWIAEGEAFKGQPITFDKIGPLGAFTRIYIPNAEVVDKGDGEFQVIPHPSPAETPQLELDDCVQFQNSADLAFARDEYGTVVAIKRDGMAVRYDVKMSNGGWVAVDLKPSQLIKQ